MKEFIQQYQKAIVGIGALSVLVLSYFQNQEIHKLRGEKLPTNYIRAIQSLEGERDSLNSELFIEQTMVGRYEVALDILKEKNPKAAEEYELILTTQTE